MAKVKQSGLRGYVGRLGGSVYYMLNGQNVARELAAEVSNPRTMGQQRQRMRMSNLVNTYRTNRGWMGRKSFEKKNRRWTDYNAFVSQNAQPVPVYLTKTEAALGASVPAPYQFTKGTLSEIINEYEAEENVFLTTLALDGLQVEPSTTVAELSDALTRTGGNASLIQIGDQLSIIRASWSNGAGTPIIRAIEIMLDLDDTTPLEDLGLDYALLYNGLLAFDGGAIAETLTVVVSRTASGKTSVSDSHAVLNAQAQALFARYNTTAALQRAADSYGLSTEVFLDAGYQGTQGGDGGGTGGTQRITSIAGQYAADAGGMVPFTINPNGANTLRASSGEIDPMPNTAVSVYFARELEEAGPLSLVFSPAEVGAQTTVQSTSVQSNRADFSLTVAQATAIQRKAGTYSVYASANADPETLIASINVVAG